MTRTKKLSELTNSRSIKLQNKHIAILARHNIEDLTAFVVKKIEGLEPEQMDAISREIKNATENIKADIESIAGLKEDIEEKDVRIF